MSDTSHGIDSFANRPIIIFKSHDYTLQLKIGNSGLSPSFGKISHLTHQFSVKSPYQAFCFNRWHHGQIMAMHKHDCLQIYHVIEGEFHVDTGNGWERIPTGHAHILPPGHQHALRTGKTDLHLSITFHTTPDERGLIHRIITAYTQPCILPVTLPAQLHNYLQTSHLLFDELAELMLINLFDTYCLNLLSQTQQGETQIRRQKLLDYLQTHQDQSLTVKQITAHMQMSRTNLQRFCSDQFQCGVRAMHERIRMEVLD